MGHTTSTDQFAALLAENFTAVNYNEKKKTGTAWIPNVGQIEFRESSNDPSTIVKILIPNRFKGNSESAVEFIAKLQDAWSNSD